MKSFGFGPGFLHGHRKRSMGRRSQAAHTDPLAAKLLKRFHLRLRDNIVDQPIGDDQHRARRAPSQGSAHRAGANAGQNI